MKLRYLILALALGSCNSATSVSAGGTFVVAVVDEEFRVRIDNSLLATQARRMMSGQDKQKIVTGKLLRGDGGFNTGYHWHIDPAAVGFADLTIELCDGKPSEVEKNIDYWVDTVKQYCPWGGHFVREVGRF